MAVFRSIHCHINPVRIFDINFFLLICNICALINHAEIPSLQQFFIHLCPLIHKNIIHQISFLTELSEKFQPRKILRICISIVQFSIFFPWNRQKVLQVFSKRYTSRTVKYMRPDRNQWFSIDFREHFYCFFYSRLKSFLCRHVRASDCFVYIFAHEKGLVRSNIIPFFHIFGRIGGIRISIYIPLFIRIPVDHGRICNFIKIHVILIGQIIQRID